MTETSIPLDTVNEKIAATPQASFRFTDEAVAAIVRLASNCGHIETLRALELETTKRLAQQTVFIPSIDPLVAASVWHRPVLLFAANAEISGITLGSTVYLRSPHDLSRWRLLVHEFVHVAQFYLEGPPGFLARYASEYVQSRIRGQTDRDAYLGLQAELEARAAEQPAQQYRPACLPYVTPLNRH